MLIMIMTTTSGADSNRRRSDAGSAQQVCQKWSKSVPTVRQQRSKVIRMCSKLDPKVFRSVPNSVPRVIQK
eukprot:15763428-Heterocapsa_arctica.AAC.1